MSQQIPKMLRWKNVGVKRVQRESGRWRTGYALDYAACLVRWVARFLFRYDTLIRRLKMLYAE